MKNWRRTFITLWSGQAVSILTSSVLQMSIVWYLTEATGSAAYLSAATLIGFLPQAVLGAFIGVFIDRNNRKRIMMIADIGIALAGLALAIVGIMGSIPIWLIFVVLFIRSIGAAFHTPALQAITPSIVPKEELTRYAGFSHGFKSISMIISPALGALLFSIWDLSIIVLMDVVGALIAVSMLFFIKIPERDHQAEKQASLFREAKEGFSVIRKEDGLVALIVISAVYAMIYFPIGTLFPLITINYFGGGVSGSGLVEVVFSVGMLAGSFLLGLIGKRINKMKTIVRSIAVYGFAVLAAGLLPQNGLPVFVVLSFIIGIANPLFNGTQTAIVQTRIEEKYLGRVLSLTSSTSMIAMPVGLILSGLFAEIVGVNRWFIVSGILTIILALIAFMVPSIRHGFKENR